jgi:hypothetical protein
LTVKAIAYDLDGGQTSSAQISITVAAATAVPRFIVFQKSTDQATITSYQFDIFANGANTSTAKPLKSVNLGKPTPDASGDIRVDQSAVFSSLAAGTYQATVTAISPTGQGRSAAITFTR